MSCILDFALGSRPTFLSHCMSPILDFALGSRPIILSHNSWPQGVEVNILLDPAAERPLKTQLDGVLGDLKQHGFDFNSNYVRAISSTKYQVIGAVPQDTIQKVRDSKIIGVTNIVARHAYFIGCWRTEFGCRVEAFFGGFEFCAYNDHDLRSFGIR
jgi:hypothetical protein